MNENIVCVMKGFHLNYRPVVAAPLDVGDGLGEDLGEDGKEGEDGGTGHELGHLVHALVDGLRV